MTHWTNDIKPSKDSLLKKITVNIEIDINPGEAIYNIKFDRLCVEKVQIINIRTENIDKNDKIGIRIVDRFKAEKPFVTYKFGCDFSVMISGKDKIEIKIDKKSGFKSTINLLSTIHLNSEASKPVYKVF